MVVEQREDKLTGEHSDREMMLKRQNGKLMFMMMVIIRWRLGLMMLMVVIIRWRLGEWQDFGELALGKLPDHRLHRGVRKLSRLVGNYF